MNNLATLESPFISATGLQQRGIVKRLTGVNFPLLTWLLIIVQSTSDGL